VQFGTPSWYESVGVGYDSNNNVFVTGNGHTSNNTSSFYIDKNGVPTPTGLNLPMISQVAFEFMSDNNKTPFTGSLIQPNDADYWNNLYVQGYVKAADSTWTTLPLLTSLAKKAGTAKFIGYTGSTSQVPIWSIDGSFITGGYVDSCQIKLSPTESSIAIFAIGGTLIPNYQPDMTVDSFSLKVFHALKGVKIQNGQLVEVPLNIKNQQQLNVNSNFMECRDVNNDGYQDIVVYRYNTNDNSEYLHVYLNNKNNGFDYVDQSKFPIFAQLSSQDALVGWSSLYHDFDGDGVADIIIYPSSTKSTTWQYDKGIKLSQ
jgi:hypothetical protein